MKRASSTGLLLEVSDKDATKQLAMYNAVRQGIISGTIAPAQRLPSTRDFANAYGISRGTAVIVYDLLQSEGYVVSRPGAGTFAASSLPDVRMTVSRTDRPRDMVPAPRWDSEQSLSSAAREFLTAAAPAMPPRPRPLTPSLPALDEFPVSLWARLCAKHSRLLKPELMGHAYPAGIPKLRAALAQHLKLTRGIDCTPEQVLLTASTGQALQLAARLLVEQGGNVAVEVPGQPDVGALLRSAGFQVVPVPVDSEGVLPDACLAANLIYVSPAHHCATGVAMSPARRRTLVDTAAARGTWIFENDAGSEFRYDGHPTPALFSMSRGGGVIHAGSFDQTLFPALHISYLVVPLALAGVFERAHAIHGRPPTAVSQLVLSDFMESGHYVRHLRRMTECYRERRAALATALMREFGLAIQLMQPASGLDLIVHWRDDRIAEAIDNAARAHKLHVEPLSTFSSGKPARRGALLGFGAHPVPVLQAAVASLALALHDSREELPDVSFAPRSWSPPPAAQRAGY